MGKKVITQLGGQKPMHSTVDRQRWVDKQTDRQNVLVFCIQRVMSRYSNVIFLSLCGCFCAAISAKKKSDSKARFHTGILLLVPSCIMFAVRALTVVQIRVAITGCCCMTRHRLHPHLMSSPV